MKKSCQTLGHWVVINETFYDGNRNRLMVQWRCPLCGEESVQDASKVQRRRDLQLWTIIVVIACLTLIATIYWLGRG